MEKVVDYVAQKEKSTSAMREILLIAQRKVEHKSRNNFSKKLIQDSKEFFSYWYKIKGMGSREHPYLILIPLFFLAHIFSAKETTVDILLLSFILPFFFKFYLIVSRTKKEYIKDMLGNMEEIKDKQREFYINGILAEVYGIEKIKIKIAYAFFLFTVSISSAFIAVFWLTKYKPILLSISLISTVAFFTTKLKEEKKYKG